MTSRAEQQPDGWDRGAEGYARFAAACTSLFVDDLLEMAPAEPGTRGLDVATGSGVVALEAARRGAEVDAIDRAPAMARQVAVAAREEGLSRLAVRCMDGQRLAYADGTFDVVWSLFGVILFADVALGLAECLRVVRPGGRVAIGAWGARQDASRILFGALSRALPGSARSVDAPAWARFANVALLSKALTEAGLRDVEVQTVTRAWLAPPAAEFWQRLPTLSPTSAAALARLDAASRERLGKQVIADLEARFGQGPIGLRSEAHLAVATKAW